MIKIELNSIYINAFFTSCLTPHLLVLLTIYKQVDHVIKNIVKFMKMIETFWIAVLNEKEYLGFILILCRSLGCLQYIYIFSYIS